MNHRSHLFAFTLTLAAMLLGSGGCGGSGGWPDIPPRFTYPRMSLRWGDRSRAIRGPGSALSVKITMSDAGVSGEDVVCSVDRRSAPGAYSQLFTMDERCLTGTFHVTVRFYAEPEGRGDVVGTGSAWVHLEPTGTGIDTIAITNSVRSVSIDSNQSVAVGGSKELTFTTRDRQGALVGVSPGSATWSVMDGTALGLTRDGVATGLAAGTSSVRVTVDGVTSEPTRVSVSQGSGR